MYWHRKPPFKWNSGRKCCLSELCPSLRKTFSCLVERPELYTGLPATGGHQDQIGSLRAKPAKWEVSGNNQLTHSWIIVLCFIRQVLLGEREGVSLLLPNQDFSHSGCFGICLFAPGSASSHFVSSSIHSQHPVFVSFCISFCISSSRLCISGFCLFLPHCPSP